MSVWYWIAVWVGASPVFALFVGRFAKVANPPEKRVVTVGELARMFDEIDAHLVKQAGEVR